MAGFNRVILIGNLTRDPQVKQLPSNTTVAEFGLAVTRKYRTQGGEDREETCFVDCAAFGKQARECDGAVRREHGLRRFDHYFEPQRPRRQLAPILERVAR